MARDRKLTILVTEDERRRIRAACALREVTLSDVVRDHLIPWAESVLDEFYPEVAPGWRWIDPSKRSVLSEAFWASRKTGAESVSEAEQ